MNRRGHIGTVLMVFGALLLVGVALYSFYGFKENIKSIDAEFRGLSLEMWDFRNMILNYMNVLISESIKQSNPNNFEETFKDKLKELTISGGGKNTDNSYEFVKNNVFAKIVDGEFTVEKFDDVGNYLLSIRNLSFSINTKDEEKGINSINYNFNITSKFNNKWVESLTLG